LTDHASVTSSIAPFVPKDRRKQAHTAFSFSHFINALLWGAVALWLLLAVPIAWFDRQGRWITPGTDTWVWIKLWLYWAVWASGPAIAAVLLRIARWRPRGRATPAGSDHPGPAHRASHASHIAHSTPGRRDSLPALLLLLAALALGAWSSLIEPRTLHVRHHHWTAPPGAPALRVALVADLHLGLFWREWQLRQLVTRLNALDVDAVLVAGDWTYEPPRDLQAAFAPLRALRHPVHAVMGNHDLQSPGANYRVPLQNALAAAGVQLVEGRSVPLGPAGGRWRLVGLDDPWGGDPTRQIKALLNTPDPHRLVLTHQPDTAALLPPNAAFLTLAGHTHGGQIRLPWLTEWVLQRGTSQPWYQGRYALPQGGQLMVSSGVGLIGLPARLGVAPRIDVLHLDAAP
jgi:hypothetical protein